MSLAANFFPRREPTCLKTPRYFLRFPSRSLHVPYSFVVCLRFGCDSPGWKLKPTVPYQEVGTGAD